jgi:hypothetical protein
MTASRAVLAIFVVFALMPVRGSFADALKRNDQTAQNPGAPKSDGALIRVQSPGPSLPPASRLNSDYLQILRPPATDQENSPKQGAGPAQEAPVPAASERAQFPARKLQKGDLSKLAKLAKGMQPGQWMEISPKNCALNKVKCRGPFKLSSVFLKKNLYPPAYGALSVRERSSPPGGRASGMANGSISAMAVIMTITATMSWLTTQSGSASFGWQIRLRSSILASQPVTRRADRRPLIPMTERSGFRLRAKHGSPAPSVIAAP